MANTFSKEERVAFEDVLEGFQDALVLSRNVSTYSVAGEKLERAGDTIWRPQPYIAESVNGPAGTDISASFKDVKQLAVPATIGFNKTVPISLTANELRDQLQEGRLGDAAKQKLASDINVAIMNTASNEGTIVVKRTAAASGFDDVAECEAAFNEIGVPSYDRYLALSTRDYNGMASNLAGRGTLAGKALTAYERAAIGEIASFDAYKLDYANRLTAAAGTSVTVNGANQYHEPLSSESTTAGEVNVDNRTQNLTIAVGGGTVKVGDCFTIAGVNAVHQITKQDTGQLKTFRITAIVSGGGGSGVVKISPAIISDGGSTDAGAQYKNVTATPANGAAITFLNTVDANVNPFWQKDSLEILPARYVHDENAGVAIMRATTDQGFEVCMSKQYDIDTNSYKIRFDTRFGVVNKQPEMSGIMLFSQT
jgi:hypothetical protein